jgi:2-iminobutanoate/2-iminopropanoate deaminase
MAHNKQIIGGDLVIGGRKLTLSKAVRAGDMIYVTGQVPFRDGEVMTDGNIEDQTRAVLDQARDILGEAGCDLSHVVKAMVWLRERADFPGFNSVYGKYFPKDPPARSAVINELLVDVRVEIEVVAYDPQQLFTNRT